MSWYVLQCRTGQEDIIVRSCRHHLSSRALDDVFSFRCERLWRVDGVWRLVEKEMFPGYVFLESHYPEYLSQELEQYRKILKVMEEPRYLISVYEDEEKNLRGLCDESHYLKLSYGYKEDGLIYITEGPLRGLENQIIRIDWHRRFAQVEVSVAKKKAVVWAGIGIDEKAMKGRTQVS